MSTIGHNRPDVWVGKRSTKRSYRIKSKSTKSSASNETDEETCSVITTETCPSKPSNRLDQKTKKLGLSTSLHTDAYSYRPDEFLGDQAQQRKTSKDHRKKKLGSWGSPLHDNNNNTNFCHNTDKQQQGRSVISDLRPDGWVGQKPTKRSYRIKSSRSNAPPTRSSKMIGDETTQSISTCPAEFQKQTEVSPCTTQDNNDNKDGKKKLGLSTSLHTDAYAYRPDEFLGQSQPQRKKKTSTTKRHSKLGRSTSLHGDYKQSTISTLRPDGWVGQKSTKRSWRVKPKSYHTTPAAIQEEKSGVDEEDMNDSASFADCTFQEEWLPSKKEAHTSDDEEAILPGGVPVVIHPFKFNKNGKQRSSVLDESVHSLLTECTSFNDSSNEDMLWQSSHAIDEKNDAVTDTGIVAPNSLKPHEMLPMRPSSENTSNLNTTKVDSPTPNYECCGHNCPGGFVGQRSTKRSWKVKSKSAPSGRDVYTGDSQSVRSEIVTPNEDDAASIGTCTFDVGILSAGKLKKDESHGKGTIPHVINHSIHSDKHRSSCLDENSMRSVLTEDSRSRVANAREKWNIMCKTRDLMKHCPTRSVGMPSTGDVSSVVARWNQVSSCNQTANARAAKLNIRNVYSVSNALPKTGINLIKQTKPDHVHDKHKESSSDDDLGKVREMPCGKETLPDLELSMTSITASTSEIDSITSWKSPVGGRNCYNSPSKTMRKSRLSPLSSKQQQKQHNIRAVNRPDDWVGGSSHHSSRSKPKRSWKIKRIIE